MGIGTGNSTLPNMIEVICTYIGWDRTGDKMTLEIQVILIISFSPENWPDSTPNIPVLPYVLYTLDTLQIVKQTFKTHFKQPCGAALIYPRI